MLWETDSETAKKDSERETALNKQTEATAERERQSSNSCLCACGTVNSGVGGFRVSLESQYNSTTVSLKTLYTVQMTPCHAW